MLKTTVLLSALLLGLVSGQDPQGCCQLTRWGDWLPVNCQAGIRQLRFRTLTVRSAGECTGARCSEQTVESRECQASCQPVDCRWSAWRVLIPCSYRSGFHIRSIERPAQCGGKACEGPSYSEACDPANDCTPVDCLFSAWQPTGGCVGGYQLMTRDVTRQEACGGKPCSGDRVQRNVCTGTGGQGLQEPTTNIGTTRPPQQRVPAGGSCGPTTCPPGQTCTMTQAPCPPGMMCAQVLTPVCSAGPSAPCMMRPCAVQVPCEIGFKHDAQGCPTCECEMTNPCAATSCLTGSRCVPTYQCNYNLQVRTCGYIGQCESIIAFSTRAPSDYVCPPNSCPVGFYCRMETPVCPPGMACPQVLQPICTPVYTTPRPDSVCPPNSCPPGVSCKMGMPPCPPGMACIQVMQPICGPPEIGVATTIRPRSNDCPAGSCPPGVSCSMVQPPCPPGMACIQSLQPVCGSGVACPAIGCRMACEFGFTRDANGCEICACNSNPCAVISCLVGDTCVVRKDCDQNDQDCKFMAACEKQTECPLRKCTENCEYGYTQDENGCNTCECNFHPCVAMLCPAGSACLIRKSCRVEGSSQCRVYGTCGNPINEQCTEPECLKFIRCGYGIKYVDGCPTCECLPDPCANACPVGQSCTVQFVQCIRAPCPPIAVCSDPGPICKAVMCDLGCQYGFVTGSDGCQTCGCAPPPICSPVRCSNVCDRGFTTDVNGCQTCTCRPPPTCADVKCHPGDVCTLEQVVCIRAPCDPVPVCKSTSRCPDGQPEEQIAGGGSKFCGRGPSRQDCSAGYTCNIDPADRFAVCCPDSVNQDQCPPVCEIFCQYGKIEDDNGCPTCRCASDPCQERSCPSGEVCISRPSQCRGDNCRHVAECIGCPAVLCIQACANGYVYDKNGCQTCDCVGGQVSTCATLQCPTGQACELVYPPCAAGSTNCNPVPVCRDPRPQCAPCAPGCKTGPPVATGCPTCTCDSCSTLQCPTGQVCELVYPPCAPGSTNCNPVPVCRDSPTRPQCAACAPGCKTGPPVPTGCPTCTCDACSLFNCPSGQRCQLQQVKCVRAPCDTVPTCMAVGTTLPPMRG